MSKEKEVKGNVVDMEGVEVEATVKDAPKKKKMDLSTKVAIAGLVIGIPLCFVAFVMPVGGSSKGKSFKKVSAKEPIPPVPVEPTTPDIPPIEPVVEPAVPEMV